MSGGSWDYVSFQIDAVADRLINEKCPRRRALGKQMHLIGKAMHDIEWADSGDTAEGSDIPAINAALGKHAEALVLEVLCEDARALIAELKKYTHDSKE